MDKREMCFYGVDKQTGKVVEIAIARGWKKVYRTAKKWHWESESDWNEQQVREMRNEGLIVGTAPVCDVRIGMRAGRDTNGKAYLLATELRESAYTAPMAVVA